MWQRKKKLYGKNANYSISKKLRNDKDITEEFEVLLNSLSLEEIIALKLELGAKSINNKLYGFPIWKGINHMVKEALIKAALSITRTKGEAARFLGLNRAYFSELEKKYDTGSYFEDKT
tara:strand:+ start:2145 stop:2501 length:357 start_codon:yes stop_codon:yes gene_type:complete